MFYLTVKSSTEGCLTTRCRLIGYLTNNPHRSNNLPDHPYSVNQIFRANIRRPSVRCIHGSCYVRKLSN